ncbi:N-acetylmuramoyl-L-alanine amidase [bacterium]|nr:N-acetylmuramoyl-L-alanine amidase [bacterium]
MFQNTISEFIVHYFRCHESNTGMIVTEISNSIAVPVAQHEEWSLLQSEEDGGYDIGLLEYQNTWKIAGYLKKILENRTHTIHLTKTEHDNPTSQQRAQVALDNDCDSFRTLPRKCCVIDFHDGFRYTQ